MPSVEKEAPLIVPNVGWLAQALCGWHDAESGREPGESFPCSACLAQAEYVGSWLK